MNNKGLLYSIMTLFLVLSIIGLNTVLTDINRDASALENATFLSTVSNKYNNLDSMIITLNKDGYNKEVSERILPFKYEIDKNKITIINNFPNNTERFVEVFDLLNLSEIFSEDNNRSNFYDGLPVDINAPKNSFWSGSDTTFDVLINPFCYSFTPDLNSINFFSSTSDKCSASFDSSKIERIEINIKIKNPGDDYNSFTCNGGVCPQETFLQSPYLTINIDTNNCTNCALTQKTTSKNFSLLDTNQIVLSCIGAACTSLPLTINQNGLNFDINSANEIDVNYSVIFSEDISDFLFDNIDLKVTNQEGTVSKEN